MRRNTPARSSHHRDSVSRPRALARAVASLVLLTATSSIGVGTALADPTPTSPSPSSSTPSAPAGGAGTAAPVETAALDAVVLVDESGSLNDQDVAREKEAVSLLAQGMLNPRSRITVVGFGSQNRPGQSAVDVVCPPTVLDSSAAKTGIARCADRLHRRTGDQGNDTDHAAALAQALGYFENGSPSGATRVVFLLTDGNLDVPNSPQYGQVAGTRNAAALAAAREQLGRARRLNAQIWPLGFGAEIDKARLEEFARGGAQSTCLPSTARVVTDRALVAQTLFGVFVAASCGAGPAPTPPQPVPASFTVSVPEIATDGSILVAKSDPGLIVRYVQPDGRQAPTNGSLGDSQFTLSGQGSLVEALRIVNPQTGTWKVDVSAPSGAGAQTASVMALWQGAVRAAVYSEPSSATPGQAVTVKVQLTTRQNVAPSAAGLKNVAVTVSAVGTGDGAAAARSGTIRVHDDGQAPDAKAGDGIYSGTYTAPGQTGSVQLTATVTGPGINANPLPETLLIADQAQLVAVSLSLDVPDQVTTGDTVAGTISAHNPTNGPIPARLVLDGGNGAVRLGSNPDVTLSPGTSTPSFTLQFPSDGRTGPMAARLSLVDAGDPSRVYGALPITTTVNPPPNLFQRYWWALLTLILLGLAGALVWWLMRRAKTRREDVSRLVMFLIGPDGRQLGPSLPAPGRPARVLKFHLLGIDGDPSSGPPRLANADPMGRGIALEARRLGPDLVRVDGPNNLTAKLTVAGEAVPFWDSWALRVGVKPGSGGTNQPAPPDPSSASGDQWQDLWGAPGATSAAWAPGSSPGGPAGQSAPARPGSAQPVSTGSPGGATVPGSAPTMPVSPGSGTQPMPGPAGPPPGGGSPPAAPLKDDPWM